MKHASAPVFQVRTGLVFVWGEGGAEAFIHSSATAVQAVPKLVDEVKCLTFCFGTQTYELTIYLT